MLVLSRKQGQEIVIGDNIRIVVLTCEGTVRLGIEAPKEVEIHRLEVKRAQERMRKSSEDASESTNK